MQNPHFGSKIKIKKKHLKIHSTNYLQLLWRKTAPKNTKYSRNKSILKIGHHACKGYSPCKILNLAQKLKLKKKCQNPFYKSFRVVVCKKTLQKNSIFEKGEHFENRPSCMQSL